MKHLKIYEHFDINFKVGDVVICIDDSKYEPWKLKYGETYDVLKVFNGDTLKIMEVAHISSRDHINNYRIEILVSMKEFVHEKDFELYQTTNNFKI